MENYETTILIEGSMALEIAKTAIMPAAIKQQSAYTEILLNLEDAGVASGTGVLKARIEAIGSLLDALCTSLDKLEKAIGKGDTAKIIATMETLREAVDGLEREVDDELWPLPKYGEMLFIY